MTCGTVTSAVELVSSAQMLVSSARCLAGLKTTPTGCCMKELAARMKKADRLTPRASIQMQARWIFLGRRSQPKIHSPRNVDSRKNAASPSIASGAPNTSPTNRE